MILIGFYFILFLCFIKYRYQDSPAGGEPEFRS
jgi:hypothetical protein